MDDRSEAWRQFRAGLPRALADITPEDGPAEDEDVAALDNGPVTPEQLLSVLREQVTLQGLGGPLVLRGAAAQIGYVAYAWREVVYRQVRAVLALFDAGLAVQAQPNARAALEHAVMLQGAAGAEAQGRGLEFLAAVEAERSEHATRAIKRLKRWDADTGGQHTALVAAALQHAKTPTVPVPDLKASTGLLFASLPSAGSAFHALWGDLSEGAHAGIVSAMPYFLPGGPGGVGPKPVRWSEALLALCWACWAADDALDAFTEARGLADRHPPLTLPLGFLPGERRHSPTSDKGSDGVTTP